MKNITYSQQRCELQFTNTNCFHNMLFNATKKDNIDKINVYINNNKLYLMFYVKNSNYKVVEYEVLLSKNTNLANGKIELLGNMSKYNEILELLCNAIKIDFSFQFGLGGLKILNFEIEYKESK